MSSNEHWAETFDTAAQDHLADERVLAAVQVTRTGGWAAMGAGQVSGLAGMVMGRRNKQRAGGLPQLFMLAVTEDRVYALGLKKIGARTPKCVTELARWDRAGLTVTSEPVFMGTKLVLDAPADGERIAIQGPEGELTDRVLRALAATPVAS